MNVDGLLRIINIIQELNERHGIQKNLVNVQDNLKNLVASPQDENHQNIYNTAMDKLKESVDKMHLEIDPRMNDLIAEINASEYFTDDLHSTIESIIDKNRITMAVGMKEIEKMISDRGDFISKLKQLSSNLDITGFKNEEIEIDTNCVEMGMIIPRNLFDNDFEKFINQLGDIRIAIRILSEIETGSSSSMIVGEISSTDPLICVGLPIAVITAIGGLILWALNVWEKIESIRSLRSAAITTQAWTDDQIKEIYDDKITEIIKEEVQKKIDEIMPKIKQKIPGRAQELASSLEWVLNTMLALVERGFKIELPRCKITENIGSDDKEEIEKINKLSNDLIFPEVDGGKKLLSLPPPLKQIDQNKKEEDDLQN